MIIVGYFLNSLKSIVQVNKKCTNPIVKVLEVLMSSLKLRLRTYTNTLGKEVEGFPCIAMMYKCVIMTYLTIGMCTIFIDFHQNVHVSLDHAKCTVEIAPPMPNWAHGLMSESGPFPLLDFSGLLIDLLRVSLIRGPKPYLSLSSGLLSEFAT